MPDPRPDESQQEFMERCIPEMMEGYQGEEPVEQDEAVARCDGIYQSWLRQKRGGMER